MYFLVSQIWIHIIKWFINIIKSDSWCCPVNLHTYSKNKFSEEHCPQPYSTVLTHLFVTDSECLIYRDTRVCGHTDQCFTKLWHYQRVTCQLDGIICQTHVIVAHLGCIFCKLNIIGSRDLLITEHNRHIELPKKTQMKPRSTQIDKKVNINYPQIHITNDRCGL